MKSFLQVMKFGGTSVGDASCIARVTEIVVKSARQNPVVVVVSAMSGVTNRLIEAATCSEAGDRDRASALLHGLRDQHALALDALIHNPETRKRLALRIEENLREAQRLCEGTALIHELTPRTLDSISSLGERLSAPLVAGALTEQGVRSEAIEATELVVTDSYHGAAEPLMDLTHQRSEARVRPLLQQGIVPVVTGFIGATPDGILTTLGRGGSDYSATILGGALGADEVIIWTDVNGVLSADPRLVPEARTIPEISYREAAELAYFGAKVLHPKTLRAVMQAGIPVWIRNTFEPENPGTKITPQGRSSSGGVKALTAISDVSLIAVGGPGIVGLAGCGRPHIFHHRQRSRERAAHLAIVIAERYLFHHFVIRRETYRRSVAPAIRPGSRASNRRTHHRGPQHRHRCRCWRKYARHRRHGRAHLQRPRPRKRKYNRHRSRLFGIEYFICRRQQ